MATLPRAMQRYRYRSRVPLSLAAVRYRSAVRYRPRPFRGWSTYA